MFKRGTEIITKLIMPFHNEMNKNDISSALFTLKNQYDSYYMILLKLNEGGARHVIFILFGNIGTYILFKAIWTMLLH